MKMLLLATMMTIGLSVHAEPVRTSQKVRGAPFEFTVFSPRVGLVTFGEFMAASGWPMINGQLVSTVRWYYSEFGFSDITPDTPFYEQWVMNDGTIAPIGIGNLASGRRYFFKVGLATRSGDLIYFTNDFEKDEDRNSIIIR